MAAVCPSMLRFSHHQLHFPSNNTTKQLSLRTHLSLPRAKPPDSSASSDDASPPPSPESETKSSLPSYIDELNESRKTKKKPKKRDKTVLRRDPIQVGVRTPREETKEKQEPKSENEGAFLLTWLGLGVLILVEGLALAASGFLPEEWDNFFVKYLYPSFTPTVFLFVGGSVAFGVIKYLEAEKMKKS